ncbi:hypothetical protein [Brevibacterium atlanticum]|uniref:hypothetical protein n=1 Tax=Brevibacterium atlanticum TaxID=2697563 RepID=UPI001421EAA5|nr:hypothetical protein [Brevibacterium atlanticum]
MIIAIIGAEIAFWVLLLGGLATRYLLGARRVSSVILACVPLIDLALVVLVSVDLLRGAEPTHAHALAAVYLGLTVAFGHQIIGRVDVWFRYRFANGPKPVKPPEGSTEEVKAIWAEWLRVLLAAAIAAVCLVIMIAVDGGAIPESISTISKHPYWGILHTIGIVTGIWFLAGPAFAGTGDPALDRPENRKTEVQRSDAP